MGSKIDPLLGAIRVSYIWKQQHCRLVHHSQYTLFKTRDLLKIITALAGPECTSHNNQQSTMHLPLDNSSMIFFFVYISFKSNLYSPFLKGSGDLRSGSVCISSTFTIFLTYGLDYSSTPLLGQGIKLNILVQFL